MAIRVERIPSKEALYERAVAIIEEVKAQGAQ